VDARLPPPAATERVTAASEPDPHNGILTHPVRRRNSQVVYVLRPMRLAGIDLGASGGKDQKRRRLASTHRGTVVAEGA